MNSENVDTPEQIDGISEDELYVLCFIYIQSIPENYDPIPHATNQTIEEYIRTISSPALNGYVHVNKFDVSNVIQKLKADEYISIDPPYYLRLKGEILLEESLSGVLGGDLSRRGLADIDRGRRSHTKGLMQTMRYLQSFSPNHFFVVPNFQVLNPRNIVLAGKSQDSKETIRIEPDALLYVDDYCPSPPQLDFARIVAIEYQQSHHEELRRKGRKYTLFSLYNQRRVAPLYVLRNLELEDKFIENLDRAESGARDDIINKYKHDQWVFICQFSDMMEGKSRTDLAYASLNYLYLPEDEKYAFWNIGTKSLPYLTEEQLQTFNEMMEAFNSIMRNSYEKD